MVVLQFILPCLQFYSNQLTTAHGLLLHHVYHGEEGHIKLALLISRADSSKYNNNLTRTQVIKVGWSLCLTEKTFRAPNTITVCMRNMVK